MTAPPAPEWPAVLARWTVEPAAVALLVAAAVAYARGRQLLGGEEDRGDPRAFWAGLSVVALALLSPLSTYAEALLSIHMVQHLLLVVVAAPLLVAARPVPALLAPLPPGVRGRVAAVGASRPARLLGHPLVAWTIFAATGWAVHFTELFDLALEHSAVHAGEHALFLASGLVFWRPVVGARPLVSYPARLLYLALAMPQNTFLALAILSARQPLYDGYAQLRRAWGPSVLADQRQGGGIMWVAGDLALLVAVLAVAARWGARERATTAG